MPASQNAKRYACGSSRAGCGGRPLSDRPGPVTGCGMAADSGSADSAARAAAGRGNCRSQTLPSSSWVSPNSRGTTAVGRYQPGGISSFTKISSQSTYRTCGQTQRRISRSRPLTTRIRRLACQNMDPIQSHHRYAMMFQKSIISSSFSLRSSSSRSCASWRRCFFVNFRSRTRKWSSGSIAPSNAWFRKVLHALPRAVCGETSAS